MDEILDFLEKVGEISYIQVFVGTDFVRRNPDDTVFVWVRAHLPDSSGRSGRPHREFMVAEFSTDRYRDPLSRGIREAMRTRKFLAKHGYQAEVV